MKQYDKKEYFIRSRYRFKERAFVLKLFCVTFNLIELEVKDEDLENGNFFIITDELKDLQVNDLLIVKNNKYKFYAFLNTVSEINSKSTYNIQILEEFKEQPLFRMSEKLNISKGDIENFTENNSIVTCYGRYFFNYVLFVYSCGTKIPYINQTFNAGKIQKMIVEKMLNKEITVEELKKYNRAIYTYGQMTEVCVPAITLKSMTTSPETKKIRDALLEKYKDKLNDPIVAKTIQDIVIASDKEYLKDDPSYLFYKSLGSKAFNVQRSKMVLNIGGIPSFSDEVGKISYIPKSLIEGYDKNHIDTLANESFKGSYTRGVETQLGGSQTNIIIRMFQGSKITMPDCGSKDGIEFNITKDNIESFDGMYEAGSDKCITKENYSVFIGKRIKKRSPQTCKGTPGATYCAKCFGKLYETRKTESLEMDGVDCTATLMQLSMKNMHGTEIKIKKINFRNFLVSKL